MTSSHACSAETYRTVNTEDLKEYDFSGAQVVLIPSVPGTHKGSTRRQYLLSFPQFDCMCFPACLQVVICTASDTCECGECWRQKTYRKSLPNHRSAREQGIARFVAGRFITLFCVVCCVRLGVQVIAQFSSLGSLTEKWMAELTQSLCTSKASRRGAGFFSNSTHRPPMQLAWPTVENVRKSIEGYAAGGCEQTARPCKCPLRSLALCCVGGGGDGAGGSIPLSDANCKPFLQSYWHHWDASVSGRSAALYPAQPSPPFFV
jgi:hypothetical protein